MLCLKYYYSATTDAARSLWSSFNIDVIVVYMVFWLKNTVPEL